MESCENCNFFSKQLPSFIQKQAAEHKVIGECTNAKVPTRLCVNYGMLCRGTHYSEKKGVQQPQIMDAASLTATNC